MDLNELKALMAASIVAGRMSGIKLKISEVKDGMITEAVKLTQKIWEEVLRQERED